jgi:hypothetical protein
MRLFIILLFNLVASGIDAQTEIKIFVEEVYIYTGELDFVNLGESGKYHCDLYLNRIKDYKSVVIQECDQNGYNKFDEESERIKLDDVLKFDSSSDFMEWLSSRTFSTQRDFKFGGKTKYLNFSPPNLFMEVHVSRDSEGDDQIANCYSWDYIFLRINNDIIIVGLINDDGEIENYIIPMKDGKSFGIVDDVRYEESSSFYQFNKANRLVQSDNHFRIVDDVNGFRLFDKIFDEPILDSVYDTIILGDNYIYLYESKGITVYDKTMSAILAVDVQAIYELDSYVQIVGRKSTYWLDYNGNKSEEKPKFSYTVCGTVPYFERFFIKKPDGYKLITIEGHGGSSEISSDTSNFSYTDNFDSLKFLNGELRHSYDGNSDIGNIFSFPYSYFVVEKGDTTQLMKFNEGELELLLSGELDIYGYNHPVKFKTGNLYGYFPQNKLAKYKRLEMFTKNFAEFELPSGQIGWIDLNGKEYYRNK